MTVYIFRNGKLVEKTLVSVPHRVQIVSDIAPYRSMVDGSMITGRAQHRTHLRDHNCIEIGNETMKTTPLPADNRKRRQVLREQLVNMSDRQADKIMSALREQSSQMAARGR